MKGYSAFQQGEAEVRGFPLPAALCSLSAEFHSSCVVQRVCSEHERNRDQSPCAGPPLDQSLRLDVRTRILL